MRGLSKSLEELNAGKAGRLYQHLGIIIHVDIVFRGSEHWDCREIKEGNLFALKDVEAGEYFRDSTAWRVRKLESVLNLKGCSEKA